MTRRLRLELKKPLQGITITFLITSYLTGCAYFKGLIGSFSEAGQDLAHARELTDRGEFSKAAEVYQLILKKYPDSSVSGDALFELSLLYISPRNKKKDFSKATDGFHTFLKRYPKHRKAEEARYLLEVLKKVESLETDIKELMELLVRLERMGRELKR